MAVQRCGTCDEDFPGIAAIMAHFEIVHNMSILDAVGEDGSTHREYVDKFYKEKGD